MHLSLNLIDIAVYAILLISIAAGFYQGLLATVANTAGYFVALLGARWFYPGMAMHVKQAGEVIPALLYYSETADMLGSVDVFRTDVAGMTQLKLEHILQNVSLPHPLGEWFSQNVLGAVFAQDGISRLGDYLSRTIAETAVNTACFLIIFLGIYVVITLLVNLAHYVVKFPQFKALDGVLGGAVGLLRGGLLVYALFLVLPSILSIAPVQMISTVVQESHTAQMFYYHNFLFDMIRSYIG